MELNGAAGEGPGDDSSNPKHGSAEPTAHRIALGEIHDPFADLFLAIDLNIAFLDFLFLYHNTMSQSFPKSRSISKPEGLS